MAQGESFCIRHRILFVLTRMNRMGTVARMSLRKVVTRSELTTVKLMERLERILLESTKLRTRRL